MSKKVLTGALAAMMAVGMAPTIAGASQTDVETLYAAAHKATLKALESGTQADINAARVAIRKLPENMEFAIGEFSKQVDNVQNPIFHKIVMSINKLDDPKELTQKNINDARATIPAELKDLNEVFAQSYSSAIDAKQLLLQRATTQAILAAQKEKTQESVDIARAFVNDVLTSTSSAIKEWAKSMSNVLDLVVLREIKVTKVVSLETNGVTVEFDALPEAIEDATIKVLDSKGKVIEVTSQDLVKGETKVKFLFKRSVNSSDLTGIWTVGGLKFNASTMQFVQDFVGLDTTDRAGMERLLKANKEIGLKNVVEADANYIAYLNHPDRVDAVTLADVQAIIDAGNKDVTTGSSVKNFIDGAEAQQPSEFLTSLEGLGFERVNPEFVNEYKTAVESLARLSNDKKIQSAVQAEIDNVNKTELDRDYNSKTTDSIVPIKDDLNDILNDIKEFYPEDKGNSVDKQDKIDKVTLKLAIAQVNESNSVKSFETALVNLGKVSKGSFDINTVNTKILADLYSYKNNIANPSKIISDVSDVIDNGTTSIIISRVNKVKTALSADLTVASNQNLAMDAFKAVADASEKEKDIPAVTGTPSIPAIINKFDFSIVKKENLNDYKTSTVPTLASVVDVNTLVSLVSAVNTNSESNLLTNIAIAAGATGNTDVEKVALLDALKAANLTGVLDSNKDAYFAEKTDFATEAGKTLEDVQRLINLVNGKVLVVNGITVNTVKSGLDMMLENNSTATLPGIVAYGKLSFSSKKDLAQMILANDTINASPDLANFGTSLNTVVNDLSAIMIKINAPVVADYAELKTILTFINNGEVVSDGATQKFVELRNANLDTSNTIISLNSFDKVREILDVAIKNPVTRVVIEE